MIPITWLLGVVGAIAAFILLNTPWNGTAPININPISTPLSWSSTSLVSPITDIHTMPAGCRPPWHGTDWNCLNKGTSYSGYSPYFWGGKWVCCTSDPNKHKMASSLMI